MVNPCPQLFGLFDQDIVMWRNIPAGVGSRDLPACTGSRAGSTRKAATCCTGTKLPPAMLAALLPGLRASHRS